MSDIMRPMPFAQLMDWALTEHQAQGSLFGVQKLVRYPRGRAIAAAFGGRMEAPFGPAAGPHTQLAQNLVAAYAAGARIFELKTVQIMDGEALSRCVPKPCITAADEGYNCEWSTELTVPQAYEEYVKAWFACELLSQELGLGDPEGFALDLSVGYDLAGIRSEKIDRFLEGMKDASASPVWQECVDWALSHLDRFQHVGEAEVRGISPRVSASVTESTLHGCPPEEIEAIATHLLTEKGFHVHVKCNPTLLGYDFARQALDRLGCGYVQFDDHHFREDLQWADAVPMLRRLSALAAERGRSFGVKLSNTFPVDVAAGELPSEEMYLSGRALFPLTIQLSRRVAEAFGGRLPISYSGGASAHNIKGLLQAGIWPVTMATELLKPGGYQRLSQIGAWWAEEGGALPPAVDPAAVAALSDGALEDPWYRKPSKPLPSRKLEEKVPLLDCFTAPCRAGCPIHLDIPAYLRAAGRGAYREALEIIVRRDPLPFLTGTLCPHPCGGKCMRGWYEAPVEIREAKLRSAQGGCDDLLAQLRPKPPRTDLRAAVVGGGPAGLAAAFFLGREGVPVTIFEAAGQLGGVPRALIPSFRISDEAIDRDVALALSMGAEVRLNTYVGSARELEDQGFTHILFATGAQRPGDPRLEYGTCLDFAQVLSALKAGDAPALGTDVAVIGGGNSAMDTARAVRRLPGVEHVRLVYRRTRREMPADAEELELALAEGVELLELLAPVGARDGVLTCRVMGLGAPDAASRRAPVDTGERVELPCTALIAAVGERIDETVDVGGHPVIGDRRRGPATIVEAIADALEAARAIVGQGLDANTEGNIEPDDNAPRSKKGTICPAGGPEDPQRCLGCPTVCEVCADVCPNRANVAVAVPGMRQRQIVHVDGLCNECGSCAVFCPYDSRPYRDKFTLFWSREDFDHSENAGFLPLEEGGCLVRLEGRTGTYDIRRDDCGVPPDLLALIRAVERDYRYLLR